MPHESFYWKGISNLKMLVSMYFYKWELIVIIILDMIHYLALCIVDLHREVSYSSFWN